MKNIQQIILDKELFQTNPEYYENLILQFYKDYGCEYTRETLNIPDMMINKSCFYSMVIEGDKIVSMCRFGEVYKRKTIYIVRQIDTLEEARGKGFASKCLLGIDEYVTEKGAKRLIAIVDDENTASIKLHQKCGYDCIEPPLYIKNDKYYFWTNALYFEKNLSKKLDEEESESLRK